MCRLYGYLSEHPTRVDCALLRAQNSLLAQSRRDGRGLASADGWGIAYYENGEPRLLREPRAAADDAAFLESAARIEARALVAHVRRASVGRVSLANTHPFRVGRWVFAHNGTVPEFDRVQERMLAGIPVGLLGLRVGSTDSELCFLWILARLAQEVPAAIADGAPLDVTMRVMREAIRRIVQWCRRCDAGAAPTLNFVISDGRRLVASRFGASLYVLRRSALGSCELCQECHCPRCREGCGRSHEPGATHRAFVVASEPFTGDGWVAVDEAGIVGAGEDLVEGRLAC